MAVIRNKSGLILILVCLALGSVSALETHTVSVAHGEALAWSAILKSIMPRWLLLAVTLPLALLLATRPARNTSRASLAARHILLFAAISVAHAIVIAWTQAWLNPVSLLFPWNARFLRAWYNAMPIVVALYGAVLTAAWALNEARQRAERTLRASQLETQLQAAQLTALKARLQPHFLYNTLHGIAALVADRRHDEAVAAIEQLSELLHASLRDDGRAVVPVLEEVALAEQYLALQRMRFGERLRFDLRVAPEASTHPVPVMLLQPIVENAVVHGLDAGQDKLSVSISAGLIPGGVELTVENDGPVVDAVAIGGNGHGVGLAATRARLATAYGDRASLHIEPRQGGGVAVRVVVPS